MARLRFIPAARRDLLELWVRIARENLAAADRVVDRIEAACTHLCDHPKLGRARPEIGDGARALVVERWLVLYRAEPGGVQIVLATSSVSPGTRNDRADGSAHGYG